MEVFASTTTAGTADSCVDSNAFVSQCPRLVSTLQQMKSVGTIQLQWTLAVVTRHAELTAVRDVDSQLSRASTSDSS